MDLRTECASLYIGFRTIDGFAILCEDPAAPPEATAWAFVSFDGPTTAAAVEHRIGAATAFRGQ